MSAVRPERITSRTEQPAPAAVVDGRTAARLPGPLETVLRQRGHKADPVLLLSEGPLAETDRAAASDLTLVSGRVTEAHLLISAGNFGAVVLVVPDARPAHLEPLLATLAPLIPTGVLLVICTPAAWERDARSSAGSARTPATDEREALHLTLLRRGFHQVWAHTWRTAPCISARRAGAARGRRVCSIIVPVFNERATFPELMRTLLAKRLDHLGIDREIILVESNSTDGTRELVAGFAGTPGLKVIWQDRPRGKGNAVRAGLRVASGEIVLIQDADLEYDLEDYEALLEPLLQERAAFVLGSRHSGTVRMRKFTDQRLLGAVLDTAHVFFTGVINVLYGQNLKDPFTMFKVFRRDCLYGLQFECNRFDFDHELVIKLLLKGYRPLEIPVNYCSRSFKQGKKIRFFRDPPTWIAADLKYRLQPLRPRF
jgi:hypothetical protein